MAVVSGHLQFLRGTTDKVQAYSPLVAEPVYDTTYNELSVGGALVAESRVESYQALREYVGAATVVKVIDSFRTGRFRKVSTTSSGYTDDSGITLIGVTGSVWQRMNVGDVHVDWFLPTNWVEGVSNDKVPFERASQYQRSKGGGKVKFFRRHLLDTATFINDLVHLQGPIPTVGRILNGVRDYALREGVLIVNPAVSIYMESSAKLSNAILMRKGIGAFPFADATQAAAELAAYAGTAVQAAAPDPQVEDCLFLGFDKAFYSNGQPRARLERVMGDCNNGIHINGSFDVLDVANCHFWNFMTYEFGEALAHRPGTGYRISNSDDWGRLRACFSFGYERGTLIESADSITISNGAADFFGEPTQTSMVGFEVTGTSKATTFINCQAASQWRGMQITTTAVDRPTVQVIGCQFWNNDGSDIRLNQGFLMASDNFFSRAPIGIYVDAASLGGIITGNRFDKCSTRPIDGTMLNVTGDNNRFEDCVDTLLGTRRVATGTSLTNRLDTVYGGSGISTITRRAGGTSAVPTALADGAVISSHQGQAHNGTAFGTIASFRFQAKGTQTTSNSGGSFVVTTCPVGSTAALDRVIFDSDGSVKPLAVTQDLGATANRWSSIYSVVGDFNGPVGVGTFTLSTLPSATTHNGRLIVVSDATGGPKVCRSNGTVWQIINTTTTVS